MEFIAMTNDTNKHGREIIPTGTVPFEPYDEYGEVLEGLSWLKLNYDAETVCGYYLLRFAPGGRCLPHIHSAIEEFMVLEGELEEDDGTVFGTGDFVRFYPGTEHYSVAPKGCLLLVVLNGRNQLT
jgi:anti-sigma factor ChrR (cupin superfamily)